MNRMPRNLSYGVLSSDVNPQSGTLAYPNRFSRSRCLLLIRFFILLALAATMFQVAMLIRRLFPSEPLILSAALVFSVLFLIGASMDFLRILRLRSEARMTETR